MYLYCYGNLHGLNLDGNKNLKKKYKNNITKTLNQLDNGEAKGQPRLGKVLLAQIL